MNPVNNRSAKSDMVHSSGKPHPPKNIATIRRVNVSHLLAIDPQTTVAKHYTKKTM